MLGSGTLTCLDDSRGGRTAEGNTDSPDSGGDQTVRLPVPAEAKGVRLDRFLASELTDYTRSALRLLQPPVAKPGVAEDQIFHAAE